MTQLPEEDTSVLFSEASANCFSPAWKMRTVNPSLRLFDNIDVDVSTAPSHEKSEPIQI